MPDIPKDIEDKITQLMACLKTSRCLLIFDDWEVLLRSGDRLGRYYPNYESYGDLLRRIGETTHQSCVIVTSQEKPRGINILESPAQQVNLLKVEGLHAADAEKIFAEKQLTGHQEYWKELIEDYRGNPLALKILATTIQEVFNSNVDDFIKFKTIMIKDLFLDNLKEQFTRLSDLEKQIAIYVSQQTKPASLQTLRDNLALSRISELIETLEALSGRSLLEKSKDKNSNQVLFALQPVVKKYDLTYHINPET